MDMISSKDNSRVKYVRALNSRKNRQDCYVVEGVKFVREAIDHKAEVKYILASSLRAEKDEVAALVSAAKAAGIECLYCEESIFDGISDTINSQGILAVLAKDKYDVNKILESYNFVILCDRVQDPGNLGTIIRTADAFGPAAVILNKGCADAYSPKVVRAAAGAMFRVPVIDGYSDEATADLKAAGFKVFSTVVSSPFSFDDVEEAKKICIVIGNEGQGISQEIIINSDLQITIKMTGRAESLNASVAAGICIYEMRKKLL